MITATPIIPPSCTNPSSLEDPQIQEEKTEQLPLPTKTTFEQLEACQFSSWYPTFRNLHKHHHDNDDDDNKSNSHQYEYRNVTIRSIVIKPLPTEFLEYLKGDGITLPRGATKLNSFLPDNNDDDDTWSSDEEKRDLTKVIDEKSTSSSDMQSNV